MALDNFPDDGLFFRTIPSDSLQAAAIAIAGVLFVGWRQMAARRPRCVGGKAFIGMSRADLIAVCGEPYEIHTIVYGHEKKEEQFVYGRVYREYVFLTNGIVKSVSY